MEFRLGDIYLPDPSVILYELRRNERLRGKVIGMSDSGERQDAFVIVEVKDVQHRIVVPVDRCVVQD